jgi:hypothetical protein
MRSDTMTGLTPAHTKSAQKIVDDGIAASAAYGYNKTRFLGMLQKRLQ